MATKPPTSNGLDGLVFRGKMKEKLLVETCWNSLFFFKPKIAHWNSSENHHKKMSSSALCELCNKPVFAGFLNPPENWGAPCGLFFGIPNVNTIWYPSGLTPNSPQKLSNQSHHLSKTSNISPSPWSPCLRRRRLIATGSKLRSWMNHPENSESCGKPM